MIRTSYLVGGGLLVAASCWLFPPFHVVRLPKNNQGQPQLQSRFDAASFARSFWADELIPSASNAVPVIELLKAFETDAAAARQKFCRSPGLSETTYAFVQGSGRIAALEKDSIRVKLDGTTNNEVELSTGLLFGNAVRDATGLLDVNRFPNSQDFNDLSTELNQLVENQVLPSLREHAAIGKTLRFTGCLELDSGDLPKVLSVIPVTVNSR